VSRSSPRSQSLWRAGLVAGAVLIAAGVALALTNLSLGNVASALGEARPAWVAAAFALMVIAFLARALSWHEVLRAALPEKRIPLMAVTRAAMIGVMGSAIFPGRLGEPARVLVLARRVPGSNRRAVPVLAGTLVSQTLMNLSALAILAIVTFSSVSIFHGHEDGVLAGGILAGVLVVLLLAGPRLLRLGGRSRRPRLARAASFVAGQLAHARTGLAVFSRPRHASAAVAAQLGAWALQCLSCYAVLLALPGTAHVGIVAAAAVLLAVNVSAVLPPTPANVGVFQAACLVVLAAFGVAASTALAYGFLLQAIEVVTAIALGGPALLREGMSWGDVRRAAEAERRAEHAAARRAQTVPGVISECTAPAARDASRPGHPVAA
jgi:phosphatidylinositol alpha-mannosyltransferase